MKVQLQQINSQEEIDKLAIAAKEIWQECFTEIITTEQIDYMVEKFQSAKAIMAQIKQEGYLYFGLKRGELYIGYVAVCPQDSALFLSKVYLKQAYRGKGYASMLLNKAEEVAAGRNLSKIYLTVNRQNRHAIDVYLKKGFVIKEEKAADIGNGFVMDDYILEKEMTRTE